MEYKLTSNFKYPEHFKTPGDGFFNYHEKWIPQWENILSGYKLQKDVIAIEIGSFVGGSAVHLLESILCGDSSFLYCIDINAHPLLLENLRPYEGKTKFIQGKSADILPKLSHTGKETAFADIIYIDGSHLAVDVLTDAIFAFRLLKPGGVMIFDDYGWGIHTTDETQKPKLGIDSFLRAYQKYYDILPNCGWQIYVRKNFYEHTHDKAKANYETDGGNIA